MSRRPCSHRLMICLGRRAASGERFPVHVHRAVEGGYRAEVPAIPDCVTQAESLPQLRQNLREAISGCLDSNDHFAVVVARAKNAGKRTGSSNEVRTRPGLTGKQ